jgi:hypothetical protein
MFQNHLGASSAEIRSPSPDLCVMGHSYPPPLKQFALPPFSACLERQTTSK